MPESGLVPRLVVVEVLKGIDFGSENLTSVLALPSLDVIGRFPE